MNFPKNTIMILILSANSDNISNDVVRGLAYKGKRFTRIYEPQNLDKRRAEIWLCPLWKDYERGGILDRLPREYKDYVKIN